VRGGTFHEVLPFFLAQLLGAVAGAALVWLHYLPHWRETADPGAKLACFCTAPAIRSTLPNFLSELIGTFVLVFVVGAIFSKAVSASGPASGSGPYLVGQPGLGNRPVPRRHDRLRHQSRARLRPAPGPRDASDSRKRRRGLELRSHSSPGTSSRRRVGRLGAAAP
jgi:hypothetical protein